MTRREDSRSGDLYEGLHALEQFWQVRLPEAFCNLYAHFFPHPFLAPCEFFTLDAIVEGAGRGFGMIPQYLPFGKAVGEGGTYGFYVTSETGRWPICYWDEDEMYLRPVASNFAAFLRHCAILGRYETEDQMLEELPEGGEPSARQEFAQRVGLPVELLLEPIPRNDTELYERLVASDPQDAVNLCHLGCVRRARGDEERALDFFYRAGEAAPWFGDPAYLVADVYRERGNFARAVEGWWSVVQRLLPLCTRTWEWDLGEEHPEADIYEVAADGLAQHGNLAESALQSSPLWRAVVREDPYDPDVRESLGGALLAQKDVAGAEREYLNALSLCFTERGKQPDRLYAALLVLYERAGRERDAALVRYDSALPRPTI